MTVTTTASLAATSAVVAFGADIPCVPQSLVTVGSVTTITCTIVRGGVADRSSSSSNTAAAAITVTLQPFGTATTSSAPTLDRRLVVTAVSPSTFGTAGGTAVTITGSGFSPLVAVNTVTLMASGVPVATCDVTTTTATTLVCTVVTPLTPTVTSPFTTAANSSVNGTSGRSRRLSAAVSLPLSLHSHRALQASTDVSANVEPWLDASANGDGDSSSGSGGETHDIAGYVLRLLTPAHEHVATERHAATARALLSRALTATSVSVVVAVNNVTAQCDAAVCAATVDSGATPTVTAVTVQSAPSAPVVLLTGTGLSLAANVTIGGVQCVVMPTASLLPTSLSCQSPTQSAGSYSVVVAVPGIGYAAGGNFTVTYPLTVTALSLAQGGTQGGATTTLSGTGFLSSQPYLGAAMYVLFGGVNATVVSCTATSITVIVPPPKSSVPSGASLTVPVLVGIKYPLQSVAVVAPSFTYASSLSCSVWSLSPNSGGHNTVVTVFGTGFGVTAVGSTIAFSGVACVVSSWSDGSIVCAVQHPMGGHSAPLINVGGKGLCYSSSGVYFSGTGTVDTVSPVVGSYGGGQVGHLRHPALSWCVVVVVLGSTLCGAGVEWNHPQRSCGVNAADGCPGDTVPLTVSADVSV